jgi:hypothetical protein
MIKYQFYKLYYLLVNNPIKVITFLSIFITYYFAGSFEDKVYKTKVISEIEQVTEWLYVVESNSTTDKYEILTFDDKQDISKGYLIVQKYNEINILFWTLLVASILTVVIPSFISDTDVNWDITEAKKLAIRKNRCPKFKTKNKIEFISWIN